MDLNPIVLEVFGRSSARVRLPGAPRSFEETLTVEEISPLRAMELIAATWSKYENGRNFYPTKLEKIKFYADAMSEGRWKYDPDGDTIDITDGTVTGGRHRLHAILLSHTTQRFNVRTRTTKE